MATPVHQTHHTTAEPALQAHSSIRDPRRQAFVSLRVLFVVAPIAFGLDKFFHVMSHWDVYLAPRLDRVLPGSAHEVMHVVGVIEIAAGLVVAFAPRFGGYLVAAWLGGVITNLLLVPGFYDIALRDFGLLVAALALARLAAADRRVAELRIVKR